MPLMQPHVAEELYFMPFLHFSYFKRFFYMEHFLKKPLLNLLQYSFYFIFWFFVSGGLCDLSSLT